MKNNNNRYDFVILAPHIDDAFIGVGELIVNSLKNKFKIFYFSSSTYKFGKKDLNFEKRDQNIREKEIKQIFQILNLNQNNIQFFRMNNYKLFNEEDFKNIYSYLEKFFKENDIKKIFFPAYEGGHLEHDLVNFMVSILIKNKIIDIKRCFEFPEYTSYISFFDYNKFKRLFFGIPFKHELKRKKTKIPNLNQLNKKRKYLNLFKSQNPKDLIKNHGYPDIYYKFKSHNYQKSPYNSYSLNNLIGLFDKRYKIYNGDIKFKQFKNFIKKFK